MSVYTSAMETKLRQSAPHSYDTAQAFALDNGLPIRSVISKIKSMDLDYSPKQKTVSTAGPTIKKQEIVEAIRSTLNLKERGGDLTKSELMVILENLA
jgi:hypothetical protein